MVSKAQMLTQESIHRQLDASPQAVEAALVAIYERQTLEERVGKYSRIENGVGFSKFDAEFLTSLVEQIKRGRTLTPKQLAIARNKCKRYWRQLVTLMTTEPPPEPLVVLPVESNRPTFAPEPELSAIEAAALEEFNTW